MPEIRAEVEVQGPLEDAQALWADPRRWPNIVDDLRAVVSVDDEWPRGGRVVWESTPHGRGRVIERAQEWSEGRQVVVIEDERTLGTQTVDFQEEDGVVTVRLTLKYNLKHANAALKVVDLLFVRRSVRDSAQRSLFRYAAERAGDVSS